MLQGALSLTQPVQTVRVPTQAEVDVVLQEGSEPALMYMYIAIII